MFKSIKEKKVVVWDLPREHAARGDLTAPDYFGKQRNPEWYRYSGTYLYDRLLERGIRMITPDLYFLLPDPKPKAIAVYDRCDADMKMSLALKRAGVRLVLIVNSENPFYACRFFWDLRRISSYFDYTAIHRGVKDALSHKTRLLWLMSPHAYYGRVKKVESNFHSKKFLTLINSNRRVHWLRRLYVTVMHFIKPLPTFTNLEHYKVRLEAIKYFSRYADFDLYGVDWDKPVRYTHEYDEAVRKTWRGAPAYKFEVVKQYKFSLIFDTLLGGLVLLDRISDCLYAGSVPVYWGAPDIADVIPAGCFIDFRDFGRDFSRLDKYLRNIDENTYEEYINNINKFISSPAAYDLSQEKYVSDLIKIFEPYFS